MDRILTTIAKHKIAVAGIGVLLIVGVWFYGTFNGLYNQSVQKEVALNAQYQDNQNYLSSYILGYHEQIGVAQANTAALDQVLTDAVKGRYDSGGFAISSPMFAVMVEAYPEASAAELVKQWGKVQDYIVSGREGYRNVQSKLLDMLREYDTWRQSGIVNSFIVKTLLGVPSDRLIARTGDDQLKGQSALDRMYRIVLTQEGLDAYNNGVQGPLTP